MLSMMMTRQSLRTKLKMKSGTIQAASRNPRAAKLAPSPIGDWHLDIITRRNNLISCHERVWISITLN